MLTRMTCTQEGVTKSQPAIGCSVMHQLGTRVYTLHVYRYYPDLPNEHGGHGVFKNCDHYGKTFKTAAEGWKFCKDHGYLTDYFTSADMRARHLAKADFYRELAMRDRD